jgi:aspartate/methionine/tyrosine aminotransferase
MKIVPFALERYFAIHEFTAKYLLSSSDCESLKMSELLAMAGPDVKSLWDDLKLGYTESQGHPLLRAEIAGLYKGLERDDLVVCAPEEGIFLLMQALLEPGDHVVATFPGYQSLHEVALSIGCQVSKWEPDETAGWAFDLSQLEALLRPETRLVVINFPHNPTGFVPSNRDFESLVDLVRERGLYLFSDEMYRYLEVVEGASLPSACELYERATSLFGMSKSFGLPGLRIGWVVSQDQGVIQRILKLKDYTTICNSAPSEVLAIIALQNRESIIARQQLRVKHNLQVLDAFMEMYAKNFSWNRPIGGSICFPRMLRVRSTLDFCDRLVVDTGIMLVPSAMFQYGDKHVRLGIGRDNFQDVLVMFGEYLDNFSGWVK